MTDLSKSELGLMTLSCERVGRKAASWLAMQLLEALTGPHADSFFGESYGAILAGSVFGEPAAMSHLMEAIARRWLVSPGEFHALDEPEIQRQRSFLRGSCLLLAASISGRTDLITEAAMKRLLSYQHACGGFFNMDPGQGHGFVEAFTTAWGGRFALRFCLHNEARRAAHLLSEMLYLQTDPDNRFYFSYDTLSTAIVTRWTGRQPEARFLDYNQVRGETHQIGMTLSFLAEMHQADPAGGWNRPLADYIEKVGRWTDTLLRQPAMATVAEGLALAAWALDRSGKEALAMLPGAIMSVGESMSVSGAVEEWSAGLGPDYERKFSRLEATGWTALSCLGLSRALASLSL